MAAHSLGGLGVLDLLVPEVLGVLRDAVTVTAAQQPADLRVRQRLGRGRTLAGAVDRRGPENLPGAVNVALDPPEPALRQRDGFGNGQPAAFGQRDDLGVILMQAPFDPVLWCF